MDHFLKTWFKFNFKAGITQSDAIFHEMQSYYNYAHGNSGYFPTPADVAGYPSMSDFKVENSEETKTEVSFKSEPEITRAEFGIKLERGASPGADSGHSENGTYDSSGNESRDESRGPATPDSGHNSSPESQRENNGKNCHQKDFKIR